MFKAFLNSALSVGFLLITSVANASDLLTGINIDAKQVTVSGISSGAQMAHQLHIAYPDLFSGAGLIAGAPFGCANGSLATAMTRCMGTVANALPVEELAGNIRSAASEGKLGDAALLADDRVWIFHGELDTTVATELSEATAALYNMFIPSGNIHFVNDVKAAHNFPTKGRGTDCTVTTPPFIGDCNYDAAGELLQHLYGRLTSPAARTETELTETSLPGAVSAGLAETAYLYVPEDCKNAGQSCKAHLVLHGCAQSTVQVGKEFIELSGYLPWADANNIVLAFPQVISAAANPYACWDWWGYSGAAYRWRDGAQMNRLPRSCRWLGAP